MLLIILSHHLMVESEVHFMRSNLVQAVFIGEIYLIDGLFERGEVLQNTLVNQNVSVCQIQNSLFKVRTEQPVDDLKSCVCLAGSSSHDKQQSLLSSGDCFNGSVYGVSLIISWRISTLRRIVGLRYNFLFRIGNTLATIQLCVIPRHQFVLGWEFI